MSDLSSTSPNPIRRWGLIAAALILVSLLASLAVHLHGRSLIQQATDRFVDELGDVVPSVEHHAAVQQMINLAPSDVKGPKNAVSWLQAGAAALVWDGNEVGRVKGLNLDAPSEWSDDDLVFIDELLERNRSGLDTVQRANGLPSNTFNVDYRQGLDFEIPDLLPLLNMGHLLYLDASRAFADDDLERGMRSLKSLSRLAESLYDEPMIISQLIGFVNERLLHWGTRNALESDAPWAQDLELMARLEQLIPQHDLLATGRQLVVLDTVFMVSQSLQGRTGAPSEDFEMLPVPSKIQAYFMGHRYAAGFLDSGREAAQVAHTPLGLSADGEAPWYDSNDGRSLAANLRKYLAKAQATAGLRHLMTTSLQLRRLGLQQGAYPNPCPPFDDLSAINVFTGEPLACQVQADGSVHVSMPEVSELLHRAFSHRANWSYDIHLPPPGDPAVAIDEP